MGVPEASPTLAGGLWDPDFPDPPALPGTLGIVLVGGQGGGTSSVSQFRERAGICRASNDTNPGIFIFFFFRIEMQFHLSRSAPINNQAAASVRTGPVAVCAGGIKSRLSAPEGFLQLPDGSGAAR